MSTQQQQQQQQQQQHTTAMPTCTTPTPTHRDVHHHGRRIRMQAMTHLLEEKHPELKTEAEQVVAALVSQLPLKEDGVTADEDAVERMRAALAETRKEARNALCKMTEDGQKRQQAELKLAAARLTSMQFSTKFPPATGVPCLWGRRHGHLKHVLHKVGHMVGKGVHHFVKAAADPMMAAEKVKMHQQRIRARLQERCRGRCGTKPPAPAPAPAPSLAALVTSVPELSTLLTAVKAAGLVETLNSPGTFTVFAPNNAAFAKIPAVDLTALLADKMQLKEVILYHVLASQVLSTELKMGEQKVCTASGGVLWVTKSANGSVAVANSDRSIVANVVAADNMANNGVAHIIDAVLLPPAQPIHRGVVEYPGSQSHQYIATATTSTEQLYPELSEPTIPDVVAAIKVAIGKGVPEWNAGRTSACTAIYLACCKDLGPYDCRLEAAVLAAAGQSASKSGWILRNAMDAVCSDPHRTMV